MPAPRLVAAGLQPIAADGRDRSPARLARSGHNCRESKAPRHPVGIQVEVQQQDAGGNGCQAGIRYAGVEYADARLQAHSRMLNVAYN